MLPSSIVSISVELLFYESPDVSVLIRTELFLSLLSHTSHSPELPHLEMVIDARQFY